jgi:hypothetical protein
MRNVSCTWSTSVSCRLDPNRMCSRPTKRTSSPAEQTAIGFDAVRRQRHDARRLLDFFELDPRPACDCKKRLSFGCPGTSRAPPRRSRYDFVAAYGAIPSSFSRTAVIMEILSVIVAVVIAVRDLARHFPPVRAKMATNPGWPPAGRRSFSFCAEAEVPSGACTPTFFMWEPEETRTREVALGDIIPALHDRLGVRLRAVAEVRCRRASRSEKTRTSTAITSFLLTQEWRTALPVVRSTVPPFRSPRTAPLAVVQSSTTMGVEPEAPFMAAPIRRAAVFTVSPTTKCSCRSGDPTERVNMASGNTDHLVHNFSCRRRDTVATALASN